MDPSIDPTSPTRNKGDHESSFRKLSVEASERKYRRRSTSPGSESSDENPRQDDRGKVSMNRKNDDRKLERRHDGHHSYIRDSRVSRRDNYRKYQSSRHADDDDHLHSRPPRGASESTRREQEYDRSPDDRERNHGRTEERRRVRDRRGNDERVDRSRNFAAREPYSKEKELSRKWEADEEETLKRRKQERESERNGKNEGKCLFSPGRRDGKKDESNSEKISSAVKSKFDQPDDGKVTPSSWIAKTQGEVTVGSVCSSNNQGATPDDIDAAKVAAMKAAELVNKNIASFGTSGAVAGHMTTDQKKKLLWGNKKNNSEEAKHWDVSSFADRERQEKFNKLMGVKGGGGGGAAAAAVTATTTKGESNSAEGEARKQEELNMDLEKHYIAGLRRRDGRTVGLGL